MKRLLFALILTFTFGFSPRASADPMKEIIVSSAYGVLAGTLVGAATLAFTDRPGDNLKNIARGASLGLYAGILLGLYVAYVIPDEEDEEEVPPEQTNYPMIYPLIGDNNTVEGAAMTMKVLSF